METTDEVPRLSPTTAKILLRRSPLHAWAAHRLGGDLKDEDTEAKARGRLLDRLLLGVGPEIVEVRVFKKDKKGNATDELCTDWRTDAAKEARDEIAARGGIPVLPGGLVGYQVVVNAWLVQLAERGIRLDGTSQVKLDWTSEGTPCRGKLDHLVRSADGSTIWDVKSCDDASLDAVTRSIISYGYDVQHAAYVEGETHNRPEAAGRVRMGFIFAEPNPPYAVNVVHLAGSMRELGERKWRRAKRLWGECLRTKRFPGYESTVPVEAATWMLDQEMAQSVAAMPNDNATTEF